MYDKKSNTANNASLTTALGGSCCVRAMRRRPTGKVVLLLKGYKVQFEGKCIIRRAILLITQDSQLLSAALVACARCADVQQVKWYNYYSAVLLL